ncbi:hypothetical protein ACTXT7_000894 [Hymenolepis weldensis]
MDKTQLHAKNPSAGKINLRDITMWSGVKHVRFSDFSNTNSLTRNQLNFVEIRTVMDSLPKDSFESPDTK